MKGLIIVFVSLTMLSAAEPARAQADKWDKLNDEFITLFRQGQYDRAFVVATEALKVAEQSMGSNHPIVATSLENLGRIYETQGRPAQAEPLYKRALAIRGRLWGRITSMWPPL